VREQNCEHCGNKFSTDERYGGCYIRAFLCEKCCKKWSVFHSKNHIRLHQIFPTKTNPAWLVWTGELKDNIREVVQFT